GGCCNDACVNGGNDILNCGECGNRCEGETPYCDRGECTNTPPCEDSTTCADGFCCGAGCCAAGQLCCEIPGPITFDIVCVTPTESEPTCPMGCLQCDCNAPDTPIATPDGERPIASLRAGDLVYSIDGAAIVAVPVLMAVENPVQDHEVVRLSLEGGAVLEISAGHPLGDGRSIGDLQDGERYDGLRIESAERVGYAHPNTYDVLPDSSSGVYFAAGMPLRSTLKPD
ncbi:MAG: hypothetical protein OXT09_33490, partial [Myxococcales bacterium]|nr:hypothetical protein [Myxococcales bacterium]